MNGLWERAADRMRDQLGQVGFETWIGPLNFIGVDGRTATIEAPNRFFKDWVNERYLPLLRQSLSAEIGEPVEVKLTLGENGAMVLKSGNGNGHLNGNGSGRHASLCGESSRTEIPQRDRHPQLNPRYTFTEFVVGSGNQFAHAAALAVANQPGEKYNPLFIYGGVGLGKTHLVNAIGHQIWLHGERNKKVLFMSAEVFMNELDQFDPARQDHGIPRQVPPRRRADPRRRAVPRRPRPHPGRVFPYFQLPPQRTPSDRADLR